MLFSRWGIKNERKAVSVFETEVSKLHPGSRVESTGLFLSVEEPYLAASPDGTFFCPCHGSGVIEVKCPFNHRNSLISQALLDPTFPLDYDESTQEYFLKQDHEYYYQMQLQLFVTKNQFGFFVVYTSIDFIFVEVPYDANLLQQCIPKAKQFFLNVIMPELLAGYFVLKRDEVVLAEDPTQEGSSLLPCYCQTEEPIIVSIQYCANENCKRKYFHVKCINQLRNPPRRLTKLWSCDSCKKASRAAASKAKRDAKNRATASRNPLSSVNTIR